MVDVQDEMYQVSGNNFPRENIPFVFRRPQPHRQSHEKFSFFLGTLWSVVAPPPVCWLDLTQWSLTSCLHLTIILLAIEESQPGWRLGGRRIHSSFPLGIGPSWLLMRVLHTSISCRIGSMLACRISDDCLRCESEPGREKMKNTLFNGVRVIFCPLWKHCIMLAGKQTWGQGEFSRTHVMSLEHLVALTWVPTS